MADLKEQCVCISVASNWWGGMLPKLMKCWKYLFGEKTQVFENSSKFESAVTFVEDAEYLGMSTIDTNK